MQSKNKDMGDDLYEKCKQESDFFQEKFPDVPPISSREFLLQQEQSPESSTTTILVDVRTQPERDVSIISGAIPLKEFEGMMASQQQEQENNSSDDTIEKGKKDFSVITYCTVGYRSGVEARRLQYQYSLQGKIHNLDGIIAFTHAYAKVMENGINKNDDSVKVPYLINPKTEKRTNKVHCYGPSWDYVHSDFESVYFRPFHLKIRLLQVGWVTLWRKVQSFSALAFGRSNIE